MKEFISKWSNWWILAPKRQQLDDAFERELNELIEREVALCKTAVSRWVSVKDELPKEDGTYLTFTKNKVSESIGFTLFVDGQFMSSFVTHWAFVSRP